MADKRIHATIAYSGDNDNMNSAHIHCKLFGELDIVRGSKKEMKTQSKTGGMTCITSTQYGWKKIASITQLNPLKFKTWKLQFSRVTSIHNLNITGEMTLWEKKYLYSRCFS
jgi:hypothetical protein